MTLVSSPVTTSPSTTSAPVSAGSSPSEQLRVVGPRHRTVVIALVAVVAITVVLATGWLLLRARSGDAATTTPRSVHGIGGTPLRGGVGSAAIAAAPATVSDRSEVAHGTLGNIRVGGSSAGAAGRAASLSSPTPAWPSDESAELVHGTAGSLSDAAGAQVA